MAPSTSTGSTTVTPEQSTDHGRIIRVTDEARTKILELRAAEDDADGLGLRIEVTGTAGADYTYDLSFEKVADAGPADAVHVEEGLAVLVPDGSIDELRDATLDLPTTPGQGGLVLRNPNKPDPLAGKNLELTGDIAEKVTQLLAGQVNPALASHGGFATLVGVEGDDVFITMGGGCQGCAVSAMTLRDGIEKAIKENIPEVARVVDATDHEAGENPFYT
ncbi:Fe-S biogenesis protein NfuA [soil metagenome]